MLNKIPEHTERNMSNARILVVEPSANVRNMIQDILNQRNYIVCSVESVEAAHSELGKSNFDLIISECSFEANEGLDFVRSIRANEYLKEISFIFLSFARGASDQRVAIQAGADDFLNKPFTIDELLNAVETQLKKLSDLEVRQESKMRKIRYRFEGVLESSSDLVLFAEPDGKIQYMNTAAKMTLLKKYDDDYEQYSLYDFFFSNVINDLKTQTIEGLDSSQVWASHIELQTTRFGKKTYAISIACNKGDGETVDFFAVVGKDFSMQKRLERELENSRKMDADLQLFSRAVAQSPIPIIITDLQGFIRYANARVQEYTGYSQEELIGQNPRIFKSGAHDDEKYIELWNTIKSGNEWKGELKNRKKNGEFVWTLMRIVPIIDSYGEVENFLAIYEDITSQKMTEEKLLAAKIDAEKVSKFKSNILSNMSHELRTPINGILGMAMLIKDENVSEDVAMMAGAIHKSGKRLMNTLNALLDLSLVESAELSPFIREVNIEEVVQYVYSEMKDIVDENGLEFNFNSNLRGEIVTCDEMFLKKILQAITDNALKFTKKGKIEFRLEKEYRDGKRYIAIAVADTGIGIKHEDQAGIFGEFRQGSEGLSRRFEGSGLGLHLSSKMIELMHGKIEVTSEPGVGSIFTILVPASLKEEVAPIELNIEKTSIEPTEKSRVLVVEDNEINVQVTELFLQANYVVDIANTGLKAIQKCRNNKYDIILMDINLGSGINGIQATEEIRQLPGFSDVPIVAATGYVLSSNKEEILSKGLDYFLAKPFSKEELNEMVEKALKEKSLNIK